MNELTIGEHDVLSYLKPDTLLGALSYLVIFVILALGLSRALRAAVHSSMTRSGHIDRTTISFLQQVCTALIWVVALILYARHPLARRGPNSLHLDKDRVSTLPPTPDQSFIIC
jgi:small conductance mechanosensitive channel